MAKPVQVDGDWLAKVLDLLDGRHGCPFCGSTAPPVIVEATETFFARKGCSECNQWWGPYVLKNSMR